MKHLRALFLVSGLSLGTAAYAGWTEDWFDASAKTGSGSFAGQQRGYYSAGSFSGRLNMSSDPFLTVSPPRISAGCGGIDVFLGGASFLDEEYIVQKFERILQAAPAIAFDIAMKVMAKELSDSSKAMEAIINTLNSLQMDDCALASKIGAPLGTALGTAAASKLKELDQKVGSASTSFKNWYNGNEKQEANDGKLSDPVTTLVNDCPAQLKALFEPGLLLDNVATNVGMDGYQSLIRGQVGDVKLEMDAEGKILLGVPLDGCDDTDTYSIDAFVNGDAKRKPATGPCEVDQPGGIAQMVDTRLNSIANKMTQASGPVYTAEEQAFIDTGPIPVYALLKDSIDADNIGFTINMVTPVFAYAYAFYLVDNLYLSADKMLDEADRIFNATGASGPACDRNVYAQPLMEYTRLRAKLKDLRDLARESYLKRTSEAVSHIQFTQAFIENQQRLNKQKAAAVTSK